MERQEISNIIQDILIKNFSIEPNNFDWNQPLEKLDKNFKILGHLVFLEQLLEKELGIEASLLENISTTFHTPNDIVNLMMYK